MRHLYAKVENFGDGPKELETSLFAIISLNFVAATSFSTAQKLAFVQNYAQETGL